MEIRRIGPADAELFHEVRLASLLSEGRMCVANRLWSLSS